MSLVYYCLYSAMPEYQSVTIMVVIMDIQGITMVAMGATDITDIMDTVMVIIDIEPTVITHVIIMDLVAIIRHIKAISITQTPLTVPLPAAIIINILTTDTRVRKAQRGIFSRKVRLVLPLRFLLKKQKTTQKLESPRLVTHWPQHRLAI